MPEPEPVVEAAPEPEPVAEVIDLPWEDPAPAPVAAPQPEPTPPSEAAQAVAPREEPPLDDHAYSPAGMDRDDEPPPDDDYYPSDLDPAGFSYLDELATEHAAELSDEPAAEPEPEPAAQPATGLALQWLEMYPHLPISGMTGSIAANCTLISAEGDNWLLHLDPNHSALFNATQQRRLNEALNQHLGRTLNLSIELIRPEQETPAQAAARKRANRQREAEESIENDPFIQQMIQKFGASVRHDTIEPVDAVVTQGE